MRPSSRGRLQFVAAVILVLHGSAHAQEQPLQEQPPAQQTQRQPQQGGSAIGGLLSG